MNIMLLSPFFYPEPISTGKYNTDLVKEIVNKGYNVTVLCSHPIYPDWKVKESDKNLVGVNIIRGGLHIRYPKNSILRRAFLELWFASFVLRKVMTMRKQIDIIISIFPPSLAFSVITNFLPKKIKRIGVVHDLQSIFINQKKGVIKSFIAFLIKKVEQYGFNQCSKLILLSYEMKNNLEELYNLSAKKIEVQYPFINVSDELSNDLAHIFDKKYKHVVYSGALGEKQNPDKLIHFFNYASQRMDKVKFHIFSAGDIFISLKKNNKNPNIILHDLVPVNNIRELYYRSDVQIIPQAKETSGGSLPSKLPNLVACNTRMLLITDEGSEIESFFIKYNLGVVVNDWNNIKLFTGLEEVLCKRELEEVKKINIARKYFSLESLVNKII